MAPSYLNVSANVHPTWLDTGDNAWQLTAATLVGLQSVPGLVVLYGGIAKTKWAINSALMALYAFAAVLVCWVLWAYKMGFGNKSHLPFVGVPGPVMTLSNELEQAALPAVGSTMQFPMATMVYFQFVFAAITVVIIAGAFLGRMNFAAWMWFVPLWVTLSYTVGAFSIWGGGFLTQLGVIDYSGGYVIHISSGTAGLVGSLMIEPRLQTDREDFEPANPIMMLVGAGILWVGWNGFNGGDPFYASPDAGAAVLNTNICTAISLLVWMILDTWWWEHTSVTGSVQGIITGLVAITPAAGVVDAWAAVIIGIISSLLGWVAVNIVGDLVVLNRLDDTLRVFQTHAVAGLIGGLSVGFFATAEGCAAFGLTTPGGAIEGHWRQVYSVTCLAN
jgi:ammonium transporter, Amt family